MTEYELQKIVEEISKTFFGKPFKHHVRFNTRLTATGGRYLLRTHDIEINPKHYMLHGFREMEGIIKHELCHYHLHLESKGYKHGDQDFKALLKSVEAPRHCASVRVSEYKYLYCCTNCGLEYKRRRVMDTRKYSCGKCRGRIKFVHEVVVKRVRMGAK